MTETTASGTPVGKGDSPYEAVLEHFTRLWDAEEENSRRHAGTSRLLITGVMAFLAAGLFRFGLQALGSDAEPLHPLVEFIAKGSLLAAFGCFIWSAQYLVSKKLVRVGDRIEAVLAKGGITSSSVHLFPDEEFIQSLEEPPAGSAEYVRYQAFLATLAATKDLAHRNARRDAALYLSGRAFLGGLCLFSLSVALYLAGYTPQQELVDPPAVGIAPARISVEFAEGGSNADEDEDTAESDADVDQPEGTATESGRSPTPDARLQRENSEVDGTQ